MLENLYEKLMTLFTEGKNRIELHKARTQFFEWAGQFDESSNDFEVKMSHFTDWYLLDRNYEDGEPPIAKVDDLSITLTEEENLLLNALKKSTHGIFEFLKLKKDQIFIRDLVSGNKYLISDFKILSAFSKEQFFESRIIEVNEKLIFTGSFCFHPPQASKYILKEIKKLKKRTKKQSEEQIGLEVNKLINKFFRMKYKSEQYKHIKINEIYCENSKIKV